MVCDVLGRTFSHRYRVQIRHAADVEFREQGSERGRVAEISVTRRAGKLQSGDARSIVKTLIPERGGILRADNASPFIPETWDDFRRLYPIYDALTRQLKLPGGPYPSGSKSNGWNDKKVRERDLQWLEQMDRQVQAVHLRHFLVTPAVAREEGLRLFLLRHLNKPDKQPPDRDKIDLLLVQYFVMCAPQELIAGAIETSDVTKILQPVLGDVEPGSLEVCEPLDQILEAAQSCRSLRDFMENGLLEQGKLVKITVGDMFYEPAALVSICRFNFLLRRSFIQLLHADLRAIGSALNQLEKRGVKVVDCRRAGFSAKEHVAKLRQFHEHWKPPFQNDYSQDSAFQPYEQLMCLREDLEEALGIGPESRRASGPVAKNTQPATAAPPRATKTPEKPAAASPASPQTAARANPAPSQAVQPAEQTPPDSAALDVESLEEKVWEQLIATPPTRGRSMTTVTVENARILLSAWEVAAFISESGLDSEELRRLIVARALLSTSIERRKRLMDFKSLHQAIAHARAEIPRFQERVDQLKRTMKTDGAVNLGISLKRLLSLVEEAEQLLKGNEPKKEKR